MAITITAGAWVAGSTSVTPALPASPQAGDLHVLYVGGKPYSTTINTPAGWTPISGTNGTNGTVANGTDVGSVHWAAFYRYWVSGDGNPAVSITSGNVTLGCIHRIRPSVGSTLDVPVGCKGSDTSSGTGFSLTMDADPGITINDKLITYSTIAGNNSTFGTPTITAAGATIGSVAENPTTEGTTTTGNDLESSASTGSCTAGSSSASPVVGWTLSVAQTGGGVLVRGRESTPITLTVQELGQAHAIDGLILTQAHNLTVQELLHGHILESKSLIQVHNITVQDASEAHNLDGGISLTIVTNLVAQDMAHGHVLDGVTVTGDHYLLVQDALSTNALDMVTITQAHDILVQDISSWQALGGIGLTQEHNISVGGMDHDHILDDIILGASGYLCPGNVYQSHNLDNVILWDDYNCEVNNSVYSQAQVQDIHLLLYTGYYRRIK